jgi:hypothetical protein
MIRRPPRLLLMSDLRSVGLIGLADSGPSAAERERLQLVFADDRDGYRLVARRGQAEGSQAMMRRGHC